MHMHLNLLQKEQSKQLEIWSAIKLLIKLLVSKTLSQNNSTTNEEEIPKERYIYIYNISW